VSAGRVGLLVTAFTFPGVILTTFAGILADRYGRLRIMIPGLILFAVAGAACVFATSLPMLIALRVVQGIGASPVGSINVTLIGDLFTGRQRTKAMGFNASVLSIGTAAYPVVGGALAMLAWSAPFGLAVLARFAGSMPRLGGTRRTLATTSPGCGRSSAAVRCWRSSLPVPRSSSSSTAPTSPFFRS